MEKVLIEDIRVVRDNILSSFLSVKLGTPLYLSVKLMTNVCEESITQFPLDYALIDLSIAGTKPSQAIF